MAFNLTQSQLNAAIQDAVNRYRGKKVAYANAYAGECLSLNKQILLDITGLPMPGAVNNYFWSDSYWLYFNQSPPLPSLFVKTAYVAGTNYPMGSQVFYAATHHIATWLYDNGNGTHTVFEQNADPDGSPAGVHARANSRITGILVPIVMPDNPVVAGGKGADTTQGVTDMPIIDADNYFNRYHRAMNLIRGADISGRGFDRAEFDKNFVGQTDLRMLEAMSDDPEADRAHDWMNVGFIAKRDNWQGQISDLTAKLSAANDQITSLQHEKIVASIAPASLPSKTPDAVNLQPSVSKPVINGTVPKPTTNWLGAALINFMAFITKSKAK